MLLVKFSSTYKSSTNSRLLILTLVFLTLLSNALVAYSHDTFIAVIETVKPSMVTITANKKKGFFKTNEQREREAALGQYSDFYKDDFAKLPSKRHGSGFIIGSDTKYSWILTAAHVVLGSSKIIVTTFTGQKLRATLINNDPASDVALLRVTSTQLPILTLSQEPVKEGQSVIGVGAAFNLSMSSSLGIVSALNVTLNSSIKVPVIQTDDTVNRGTSGGAMINSRAQVVGLITKIYSNTGLFSGSSFALPSSDIKRLLAKWSIKNSPGG